MRQLLTVGSVSLLASALVVACSDDDPTPPGGTAGTAGTGTAGTPSAGSGGTNAGGTGGSSMAGSGGSDMGGSGGSSMAGSGGSSMAGSGGSGMAGTGGEDPDAGFGDDAGLADAGAEPPPCTGCIEIVQPFEAPDEEGYFQVAIGATDMSDTVVTFRVRSLFLDDTNQLTLRAFATDNSGFSFGGSPTTVTVNAAAFTDTETFIDVPLDVGAINPQGPDAGAIPDGEFDAADVIAYGIQLRVGGAFVGPASAHILVDSITFTGTSGLTDLTFSADAQGFGLNQNFGLQTSEVTHHPE